MKKIFTLCFVGLSIFVQAQTTATNFTCNDCAGNPHDLFTELNAGKVIVIDWVMPCGACVAPSVTAYNIVQSYATSNPGQVFMYIVDDYANTNCASINSFATTYNMPNTTKFVNASISMSNYGAAGMPKIIVVGGGTSHTVYYNQNGAGNATALQAAIDAALLASSVQDFNATINTNFLSPNPAKNSSVISFSLSTGSNTQLEIYNQLGEKTKTVFSGNLQQGEHQFDISTAELPNGIYFLKLTAGTATKTLKLVVAH